MRSAKPPPSIDPADFRRAASRLRKNAEKINLRALWAEAHRLTDAWQRRAAAGDLNGDTGLVSALSHAARGGDTRSAVMLASASPMRSNASRPLGPMRQVNIAADGIADTRQGGDLAASSRA